MRFSLIASALAMMAFPLVKSYPAVIAATIILSLTGETFRPANLANLSEVAPPDQRKQAFALNRLAVNLGMSTGPAAGGLLMAYSLPAIFFVDGLTSLASAAVLIAAFRVRPRALPAAGSGASGGAEPGALSKLGALADRRFLYFTVALLPVGITFFQIQGSLPLYVVRDVGLTPAMLGLVLMTNTVLIVLIEVPVNAATAAWSHRRSLAMGALLTSLGFGATALVRGPLTFALTVIVWTFGEMVLFPGSSAYVADLAPEGRRGEYMGAYSLSFGVCFSIGPWLGTLLLERFGGRVLWATMLAIGLVSTALFARLPTPHASQPNPQ
jgi:MFS family permease